MNSTAKLVMMANQIAANLAHERDAARATADHISKYWDPRMKRMIVDADPAALTPVARAAVELVSARV